MNNPLTFSLFGSLALILSSWSMVSRADNTEEKIFLDADHVQLNIETGYSVYTGNVKISQGDLKLSGDTVTVQQNKNEVERITVDGKPAHYKLIADAKTKTLIGAQIISEEIVSGTIDKLAVAIACKMPIMKLVQIDSSYSPHVQEDQIAVPLHRLIDKFGSGGE